jgi:hypothetical protein
VLDEATSASDAKAGRLALAGDYRRAYPSAMRTIDEHAEQLVAHLRFLGAPQAHPQHEPAQAHLRRGPPAHQHHRPLICAVLKLASRGWRDITMTPKAVAQIQRPAPRPRARPHQTSQVA